MNILPFNSPEFGLEISKKFLIQRKLRSLLLNIFLQTGKY